VVGDVVDDLVLFGVKGWVGGIRHGCHANQWLIASLGTITAKGRYFEPVHIIWKCAWLNRQLKWLFWPRQQSAQQMHESDPELTVPYWLLLLRS
jgi:hypothetical protein